MRGYRNNELVADFKSKFSSPVLTTHLRCLEREAAEIYTAEIFQEVKEEIMEGVALSVKEKEVKVLISHLACSGRSDVCIRTLPTRPLTAHRASSGRSDVCIGTLLTIPLIIRS